MLPAAAPRRLALRASLAALTLLAGGVQTWAHRFRIWDDLISYLDVADAYFAGSGRAALNGHWSPLYSWLLGTAIQLVRPAPEVELPVVKVVDFALFAASLAAFGRLARAAERARTAADDGSAPLPAAAYFLCAHAVFAWSSLRWLVVPRDTPDMLVACLVSLATTSLLRLRREPSRREAVVLGASLGLAYLAKTVMFPLAFAFFAVGGLANRRAIRTVLGPALVAFAVIAAPFTAALSVAKGRITIGDSGRLNYAWLINPGVPDHHWQGEPPGSGRPAHPTRKVMDGPAVFEFATPIGGTYPPWYDPSYWNEGLRPGFDVGQEARLVADNIVFCVEVFAAALVAGFGLFALLGGAPGASLRELGRQSPLLLPGLAGVGVFVTGTRLRYEFPPWGLLQTRYTAPFFVLLFLAGLAALRVQPRPQVRARVTAAAAVLSVAAGVRLGAFLARDLATARASGLGHFQARAARALEGLGVRRGDHVAIVGTDGHRVYWARLAGVKIVAEADARGYWTGDAATRARVLAALRDAGAVAVVSMPAPGSGRPRVAARTGWTPLGSTDLWALRLPRGN